MSLNNELPINSCILYLRTTLYLQLDSTKMDRASVLIQKNTEVKMMKTTPDNKILLISVLCNTQAQKMKTKEQ